MGDIVQLIVQSLALSAIYALVAVGFSLVFAATRVTQFGAGNVAVLGGVIFANVQGWAGSLGALAIALVGGLALGVLIQEAVMHLGEQRNASPIALSIGALAVGLIIDAAVGLWTGNVPQVAPPILADGFEVGGARVGWYLVYVVGVTAFLLGLVYTVIFRTLVGKAMLAVAYKPAVAIVSGINVRMVTLTAWAISTALMTGAGALFIPFAVVTRDVALPISVAGFAAAIVGGLGNFRGAVIGSIVVGLAQTLFARYVSSAYIDTLVFLVLFVVLVARPRGLFGVTAVRRA